MTPAKAATVEVDDDLFAALMTRNQAPCRWTAFLETLPPSERAAVEAAMDGGVRPHTVNATMQARGHIVPSATTILKHVRGGCACQR